MLLWFCKPFVKFNRKLNKRVNRISTTDMSLVSPQHQNNTIPQTFESFGDKTDNNRRSPHLVCRNQFILLTSFILVVKWTVTKSASRVDRWLVRGPRGTLFYSAPPGLGQVLSLYLTCSARSLTQPLQSLCLFIFKYVNGTFWDKLLKDSLHWKHCICI